MTNMVLAKAKDDRKRKPVLSVLKDRRYFQKLKMVFNALYQYTNNQICYSKQAMTISYDNFLLHKKISILGFLVVHSNEVCADDIEKLKVSLPGTAASYLLEPNRDKVPTKCGEVQKGSSNFYHVSFFFFDNYAL